jgi:hypothetical protein
MYLPLQVARSAGFAAIVSVSAVGVLALGAHTLSRWVHYYIYRLGHSSWPKAPTELMRLCFFVVLAALLALAEGRSVVTTWTGLAILGWSVFRARTQLLELYQGASRIDGRRKRSRRRRSVPNDDTSRAALQE